MMTSEGSNSIVLTVVRTVQINAKHNPRVPGASTHKTDAEHLSRPINYVQQRPFDVSHSIPTSAHNTAMLAATCGRCASRLGRSH